MIDYNKLLEEIGTFLYSPNDNITRHELKSRLSEMVARSGPRTAVRETPDDPYKMDVYLGNYDHPGCPDWAYEQLAPRIVKIHTPNIGRNFEVRVKTSDGMTYIVFHGKNSRYAHAVAQSFRNKIGSIFTKVEAEDAQFRYRVDDSIRQRSQLQWTRTMSSSI